ncbi:cysteine desulfurase [Candidatus Giovannonibacteria bacterium]|nr:cysteine desulfurase [Candidatus Giovannonibacteria bacterium]
MKNKNKIKVGKRVYLDHAAATPMDPRVFEAMEPFWVKNFGNAGGLYEEGRIAKEAVQKSREAIARLIFAKPEEIIFTSGGTEADNLAIFGTANFFKKGHIITSKFEHHAVLNPCLELEKRGFDVTYLEVGSEGIVNPEDFKKALRADTVLVSIMYANNEIGTIQPIAEIGKIIQNYRLQSANSRLIFHTDACQAAAYLDMNVNELGVDLMTVNGGKIYGPKGAGFLYKKSGVKITPMIFGGGQEMRMRSGTESAPLIVGMAKAFEIAALEREKESARLCELRDYFISELFQKITKIVLNGHDKKRLPNNVNVSILDIEGEALILFMDAHGVSFSTGSACTSESLDPSHVILALGKPYEFAHSSMRFTLGRSTNKEDLDYVLSELPKTVAWLRRVSPLELDPNAASMSHPEAFAGENLRVKAKSKSYK